jgi:hypothetical protein
VRYLVEFHLLLEDELLRLLREGRSGGGLEGRRLRVHGARRDGPVRGGLRRGLDLLGLRLLLGRLWLGLGLGRLRLGRALSAITDPRSEHPCVLRACVRACATELGAHPFVDN